MAELLLEITLRPPARDMQGRFTKASANVKLHQRDMLRELMRKGEAEQVIATFQRANSFLLRACLRSHFKVRSG